MRDPRPAFVFPGQGSQFPGMGKSWVEQFAPARRVFEEAEDHLKCQLTKVAFEGPEQTLASTQFSQLSLFVLAVAIWRVFAECFDVNAAICAGMSLGEFSALAAAQKGEWISLLQLVQKRAELMDRTCGNIPAGMIAVGKLLPTAIEAHLSDAPEPRGVWIANYNLPAQTVIAGTMGALEPVAKSLEAMGGRLTRLAVAGGFHTPLMRSAQSELVPHIDRLNLRESSADFVSSVTATVQNHPDFIRANLREQMTSPVRWWQTLECIASQRAICAIEIGGRTLTAIHRRGGLQMPAFALKEASDLASCLEGLRKTR